MLGKRGSASGPRQRSARPETTDVAVTFPWCLEQRVATRPQYMWGTLLACRVAKALGIPGIAALEFGVAGGNGLLALEQAAAAAGDLLGVDVAVYGFDIGSGMPEPVDHRDVPWLIERGMFELDEPALRSRLTSAELIIGPVAETVPEFAGAEHPPVGFAAFDLDYYSATKAAFAIFQGPADHILPRVPCYFDDLFGYGWSDYNGERAAIADFNAAHEQRKIGKIHGLRYSLPPAQTELPWHEQMYLLHALDHSGYCSPEGPLAGDWLAAHRLAPEG